MVREIQKDINELEKPSEKANQNDTSIIQDLLDTAIANKNNCLGMAANQIGHLKRIIVVRKSEEEFIVMINPNIIKKSTQKIVSTESCLSLDGARKVLRHTKVTVLYQDKKFKTRKLECTGLLARIVQHEVDHCNGVII